MEKQNLLFLAVADRAYGGDPDTIEILRLIFRRHNLDVRIELVPESEIVERARHLKPALILAGYRALPGSAPSIPKFGDAALKALKADPETRGIPILMLEVYGDIERVAQECGVDAFLRCPFKASEFLNVVTRLTGLQTGV